MSLDTNPVASAETTDTAPVQMSQSPLKKHPRSLKQSEYATSASASDGAPEDDNGAQREVCTDQTTGAASCSADPPSCTTVQAKLKVGTGTLR